MPIPAGAGMARMLVERNARSFRACWPTLVSGFFEPVFYLFSLGVGLGAVVGPVDAGHGHVVPYAVFVAPALLASSAMNGAVFDTTGNVFFKLKYARLYDSVLATPLGPRDVAVGEVTWALLRGTGYAAAFLLVMVIARAGDVLVGAADAPRGRAHRARLRRRRHGGDDVHALAGRTSTWSSSPSCRCSCSPPRSTR